MLLSQAMQVLNGVPICGLLFTALVEEAFQTEYDLYQLLPTVDLKRTNLMQDLFILREC